MTDDRARERHRNAHERAATTHDDAAAIHARAARLHEASANLHEQHAGEMVAYGDLRAADRARAIADRERLQAEHERDLANRQRSHARADRDEAGEDPTAGRGAATIEEHVVPVLYVEDAGRAVAWYARLGFAKEWEHRFEPGFPWFVSVARGGVRLYLSEHKGDARPDTLIHLYVRDIDAVSREFGVAVDEDGLAGRECDLVDPDGNRLRVATPRGASPGT